MESFNCLGVDNDLCCCKAQPAKTLFHSGIDGCFLFEAKINVKL